MSALRVHAGLSVEVGQIGSVIVIELRGAMNDYGAYALRHAVGGLFGRETTTVVLDLSRVDYVTDEGLAALAEVVAGAQAQGFHVAFAGVAPHHRRQLSQVGLAATVPSFDLDKLDAWLERECVPVHA